MARRRKYELEYGEGSFFYSEKRGLWVGRLEAGWTAKGNRRRIQVTARDKDDAWDKLTARRKKLEMEGVAAALQRDTTVSSWMEEWAKATSTHLRPRSQRANESYIRRWIIPTLGRRKLSELSAADARKLLDATINGGLSTTTAGKILATLQRALKDARAEGYTVPEPVMLARKPPVAASSRAAIPLPDAIKLIEQAERLPDGARWVAALLQGMRQGECLGLTWGAVDFDKRGIDISWQLQALPYLDREAETFRVPHGYVAKRLVGGQHLVKPKSAAGSRVVPMVPWMEAALLAWHEVAPKSPHGLVWPRGNGEPRSDAEDRAAWKELQRSAGVSKGTDGNGEPTYYVLHEARHTTATLLLAAGVDEAVITAIMGHSDYAVTQTYLHAPTELLAKALDRVAEQLQLEA